MGPASGTAMGPASGTAAGPASRTVIGPTSGTATGPAAVSPAVGRTTSCLQRAGCVQSMQAGTEVRSSSVELSWAKRWLRLLLSPGCWWSVSLLGTCGAGKGKGTDGLGLCSASEQGSEGKASGTVSLPLLPRSCSAGTAAQGGPVPPEEQPQVLGEQAGSRFTVPIPVQRLAP